MIIKVAQSGFPASAPYCQNNAKDCKYLQYQYINDR